MRLIEYCKINGFGNGISKECVDSAFHSKDEKVVAQAKRYKLNKLADNKEK
tara:strand:+ start:6862 stop:7014 length:153 start_codon:yes stop_codon:yes gene_type:complete